MGVCVEICLNDDNSLTVGIVDQPSADIEDTQPAPDIQTALKIAGHLLMNPPADGDADDSPGGGSGGDGSDASGGGDDGSDASGGSPGASAAPAGGAGGGQSASDMWQQMAAQQGPAH